MGSNSVTIMNSSLEIIDHTHAEIHEGNYNTANHFFQAVANNSYADLHMLTGSTKIIHLVAVIQSEAKSYVNFYRGSTYSNIGTSVTIFNNNENSTNTAQPNVYYIPTISSEPVR